MKLFCKATCLCILLILIIATLLACSDSTSTKNELPSTKPEDFNFVFSYGVCSKNQLDTIKGQFTKDMFTEPSVSTNLKLSDEEMDIIYSEIRRINILDYPDDFNPKSNATMTTYLTYKFKIIADGIEKSITWKVEDESYSENANQLRELFIKIQHMIENKEEYKILPVAGGGTIPFKSIKDRQYVNYYNAIMEQNGTYCTVVAIVSDQITTYVKIVKGDLPDDPNNKGELLADRIENAYLSDSEGNRWEFKNQVVYRGEDGTVMTEDSPTMNSAELSENEKLSENEATLIFHGGPSKDTEFSFEITFKGQEDNFVFNNLHAEIPPIVKRKINNASFKTDYATGTITEITYTMLETRFTIDWVGEKPTDEFSEYQIQNKGIYYNDNNEYKDFLPYPLTYKDDGEIRRNTFILNYPLNPYADLKIDRYQDQYKTYIEQFLFIPADK